MKKIFKCILFTTFIIIVAFYCLFIVLKILSADIFFAQGLARVNRGEWQKGIVGFEQAIVLNPDEPTYWRYLGKVYAKLGLFYPEEKSLQGQSKILLDKAVNLNPQNYLTLKSAFWGYLDLGNVDPVYLDEAENVGHQLVKLSPSDPTGFYYLGLVYEKKGDYEKARKFLEKAVGLKGDYEDALKKLQALEKQIILEQP